MAFNAVFHTFSKKLNSTKQPTGSGTAFTVDLKDSCSIVNPILRIHNTANWNPSSLNYCYIAEFSRYYFVNDWTYSLGEWECELESDPLASFKTEIGAMSKYVLRSSYINDKNIVDSFYPPKSKKPTFYTDTKDFLFETDLDGGMYVIGTASRDADGAGAITYYTMTSAQIRTFIRYMIQSPSDAWTATWSTLGDTLLKAAMQPFDYIKSCKWFPTTYFSLVSTNPMFGPYQSDATAQYLDSDSTNWPTISKTLDLPSNWGTSEAKYRTQPYANVFIVFNPWGIIELNPVDLADADSVTVTIYPDYISGDCLLKIFKNVGANSYFLTQSNAKIAVEISLTNNSLNIPGLGTGIAAAATALSKIGAASSAVSLASLAAGAAGILDIANSLTPTAAGSVGMQAGGSKAMDGICTLIYTTTDFAEEKNSEFGKPLCKDAILNTLPGFIMCGDGDFDSYGSEVYLQEQEKIKEYLANGFFYE